MISYLEVNIVNRTKRNLPNHPEIIYQIKLFIYIDRRRIVIDEYISVVSVFTQEPRVVLAVGTTAGGSRPKPRSI